MQSYKINGNNAHFCIIHLSPYDFSPSIITNKKNGRPSAEGQPFVILF